MTTTVTVKTHDWPARVLSFPCDDNRCPLADEQYQEIGTVEPNSEQSFVVHRNQNLLVQEMPSEAERAEAAEQS